MKMEKFHQFEELIALRAMLEFAASRAEEIGSEELAVLIDHAKRQATREINMLESDLHAVEN